MSAECWYSCLFCHRTFFLIVDLHWFFRCNQRYKEVSMFPDFNVFWQWPLPVDVHGNQMKQKMFLLSHIFYRHPVEINFFHYSIYSKLVKTTELMYSLIESSFRMLWAFSYCVCPLAGRGPSKVWTYANREKGDSYQCERLHIISSNWAPSP